MKETKHKYVKRTQRDYSMPFKLAVVQEVERTGIGVCAVARKYGIQSEKTVTTICLDIKGVDFHENRHFSTSFFSLWGYIHSLASTPNDTPSPFFLNETDWFLSYFLPIFLPDFTLFSTSI